MGYSLTKKNALYLSVNICGTKVLIEGSIFTWLAISPLSSEPREGLAFGSAKATPFFLSYVKSLSIGPAPGIEHATCRSAVKGSTNSASPGELNCGKSLPPGVAPSHTDYNSVCIVSRSC